jgi:hypothetical protein
MKELLLAAATFGSLTALTSVGASAARPAPGLYVAPSQQMLTDVDCNPHHYHHYHHRHYEHSHYRHY